MAKIKTDDKQLQALKEISEGIEQIKLIDKMLESNDYRISLVSKPKMSFTVPERNMDAITQLLERNRSRIAKIVISKAGRYAIELDDKELDLLQKQTTSKPAEKEAAADEEDLMIDEDIPLEEEA